MKQMPKERQTQLFIALMIVIVLCVTSEGVMYTLVVGAVTFTLGYHLGEIRLLENWGFTSQQRFNRGRYVLRRLGTEDLERALDHIAHGHSDRAARAMQHIVQVSASMAQDGVYVLETFGSKWEKQS